jgi:mannan endo-1,4-beta-mannosidase
MIMKQKHVWSAGIIIILMIGAFTITGNKSSSDTVCAFSAKKEWLFSFLNRAIADSMVIVGQHCGDGNAGGRGYNSYVLALGEETGEYPALIGMEYGYLPNNDLNYINGFAIKHWNAGGLVTVTWHADNPWIDGYNCRWNSVDNSKTINFRELLRDAPETVAKNSYRRELMQVGAALAELQEAGVLVLWRPFHEMNGAWFWWGPDDLKKPANRSDYLLLWKDMYETFSHDMGLKNLLWVYSPGEKHDWTISPEYFYPGDEYVDIVAMDIYREEPVFEGYEWMRNTGKPVVVGEIGPLRENFGKFDQLEVLRQLRGKAAWFLQWSSWTNARVAIIDNLNYMEMMKHPSAITLSKLPEMPE